MPQDTPSRKLDQYIVRFPDGMRDLLKKDAAANGRSMNAEIIERLALTFHGPFEWIWNLKHPELSLRTSELAQLTNEIEQLVRNFYHAVRKKRGMSDYVLDDALRADLEYSSDLLLIAKGEFDPDADRVAELGRIGAQRYKRFPVGGPLIDNPFRDGDPRRQMFIDAWKAEAGDDLFEDVMKRHNAQPIHSYSPPDPKE